MSLDFSERGEAVAASESAVTYVGNYALGTSAPWYQGWQLTEDQIEVFRQRSRMSLEAKAKAERGETIPIHPVNQPLLDPSCLMPQRTANGLRALSLFSGGGGLDLGFDRAGYSHVASIELMEVAGQTLRNNRPSWRVLSGEEGDAAEIDWKSFRGEVDVVQGGPPCQPFSQAGRRQGLADKRDLFPVFVQAVKGIRPKAFVAENVPNLASIKFRSYVNDIILTPLAGEYNITAFKLKAENFGIPQSRTRLFFVGVRKSLKRSFQPPEHRFRSGDDMFTDLPLCAGVRQALGLPEIGFDSLAPTLRSGLTGPRHTTSVNNSVSSLRRWDQLQIWPNGVAASREAASRFPAKNGHFRLSVQDCAIIQGFPAAWKFTGPVYAVLGQIGNSVVPPMAYQVAGRLAETLSL